jgi:hypothetical protein
MRSKCRESTKNKNKWKENAKKPKKLRDRDKQLRNLRGTNKDANKKIIIIMKILTQHVKTRVNAMVLDSVTMDNAKELLVLNLNKITTCMNCVKN